MEDLKARADSGDMNAQYRLATYYRVDKNQKMAFYWYEKSANQGHRVAQQYLGDIYSYGNGVLKNNLKSIEWYQKSANQGYKSARNRLFLIHGIGDAIHYDIRDELIHPKLLNPENIPHEQLILFIEGYLHERKKYECKKNEERTVYEIDKKIDEMSARMTLQHYQQIYTDLCNWVEEIVALPDELQQLRDQIDELEMECPIDPNCQKEYLEALNAFLANTTKQEDFIDVKMPINICTDDLDAFLVKELVEFYNRTKNLKYAFAKIGFIPLLNLHNALRKQIEWKQRLISYINHLHVIVPINGGYEYQKSKKQFDNARDSK